MRAATRQSTPHVIGLAREVQGQKLRCIPGIKMRTFGHVVRLNDLNGVSGKRFECVYT